jgi:transposase
MLGLAGFVLLAVSELGDEVEQAIETTERVVGCPGCGVLARLHDRRPVRVRDLPAAGRAVTLIWVKRIWRCVEPGCAVATWTERSEVIRPRASLTERARREACRRVGQDGHTVAQVAAQLGVGWATVMAAVLDYGRPLVADPGRLEHVSVLGVDETAFQGAGPRRSTSFVTGIVDLTGPTARLLDVVPGRSAKALSQWVDQRPPAWRDGVTVAALDPFRGYATALTESLPQAVRVLDCFHVTRLGFAAVDDVRRRVQQESTGHRGRREDPLFRIRRLLRRRADRLSPHAWARLLAGLEAGDRDAQISRTWIAAQDLRLIYQAGDRARAEHRLHRWLTFCADSDIPELHRLARTLDSWREELLAYFDTGGVSNGPTEATNLLIKKVKRSGHGFRNLDNYRLRLLLHCGTEWHTQQPAPLRGRLPRSAA